MYANLLNLGDLHLIPLCGSLSHLFFINEMWKELFVREGAYIQLNMNSIMRKTGYCTCKNNNSDQLRGSHATDQRLYFHYIDSTIPLLPNSLIARLWPSSVAVKPGVCQTSM